MIRFLLKSCVILCLLFIALSFFIPVQRRAENDAAETKSAVGLLAAASAFGAFISDIDGFCRRSPQSCETGKSLFGLMSEKAGQGAGLAFQWLRGGLAKGAENTDKQSGVRNTESVEAVINNAAREAPAKPAMAAPEKAALAEKKRLNAQKAEKKGLEKRKAANKAAPKPRAKAPIPRDKAH